MMWNSWAASSNTHGKLTFPIRGALRTFQKPWKSPALERSDVLRSWFAETDRLQSAEFWMAGVLDYVLKIRTLIIHGSGTGLKLTRPLSRPQVATQLSTRTSNSTEGWPAANEYLRKRSLKQCHAAALSINARPGNPRAKWLSPSCVVHEDPFNYMLGRISEISCVAMVQHLFFCPV